LDPGWAGHHRFLLKGKRILFTDHEYMSELRQSKQRACARTCRAKQAPSSSSRRSLLSFIVSSARTLFARCAYHEFDHQLLIVNYDLVYLLLCRLLAGWIGRYPYISAIVGGDDQKVGGTAQDLACVLTFGFDVRGRRDEDLAFTARIDRWVRKWGERDCWQFHKQELLSLIQQKTCLCVNTAMLCADYVNVADC
jgi:hypothetical protein